MEKYYEVKVFSADTDYYQSARDTKDLEEKINEQIFGWEHELKVTGNTGNDKIEIIGTETNCGSFKKEDKDVIFMTCTIIYKKAYL